MDELLSVRTFGRRVDRTDETVRVYIKTGKVAAVRVGNAYRIPSAEVDRFLEANRVVVEDRSAEAVGGR